jgi:nucleoside-diphosphate-sugar epimerase
MDILVTGGGGLLGRHLVAELLSRGDQVRVLALPAEDVRALDARGVEVHRGDIRRPDTLSVPMAGADAVVHLAGMIGVWRPFADYLAVNATGTEHVCRAAIAASVRRVVCVSSWTVYGMDQGEPCREDRPLAPFPEPYAQSKATGDRVVHRLIADEGLPGVIVRPGTFFGPGDRLHFDRIADRLRSGHGIIVGRGDNLLPFVFVSDVVQGLLLALEHPDAVGEAFNITTDAPLTQSEFFAATAAAIGVEAPRVHVPYRALYATASIAEHVWAVARPSRQPPLTRLGVNVFGTSNVHAIDKARERLGYEPRVPVREGIRMGESQLVERNFEGVPP